ncbi:rabphilin-1 [Bombus terrestris]|uniref:Rabphilin-1 n=1 Tax=Bombus terrestris TaxID=30195 RepID=A0A9B2K0Z0_BOMTE|nr:rabphilin-1 [Bombus terrestris]XP_012176764.2 rabphilin-1 [Bombus terrestris]
MDMTVKDISGGTRWVCPNDRHLSLRAKLQTGWSVKTGSLDSKWGTYSNSYSSGTNRCAQSFVLTEEEQQTIIQVIQRAEALNLSEQERIGRLVERLENMKRNVCIVTTTRLNERRRCSSRCLNSAHCVCSCALCGEKFGAVLGASANLCKDCRKYICQKCGIETNELNSILTNVSATREKTQERTAMQRIVSRSSSGQKQFLCRICAESREMWKKSGAWFLKGMPKYILPEKKERGWSRSIHKTSTWTIGGNKSLESAEPQDSSSDEEVTRRLALARGQSDSLSSLQRNQDSITTKTYSLSSNSAQPTSSTSKSRGQRLSPLNSREECLDQLDRSTLSITSQCSRLSPSPTSPRSRISLRASSNDSQTEQHVSFEDEIIDDKNKKLEDINEATCKLEINLCDQPKSSQILSFRSNFTTVPMIPTTTMTIVSMEQVPEQSQVYEKCIDQERNQSSSEQGNLHSNNLIDLVRQQTPEYETRQNYGTLEVALRYDPTTQCLQCKVERARGLQPMDIHGLADPFCKLNILPVDIVATTKRLRTKTVHKTRDPEFNETLNFYGTTETDIWNGKALHILILQDDPAGQDFLGEAKFPLHELQPHQTKHYNVPLQDHYTVDNEEAAWGVISSGRGQIQVSLSYCTRRRALTVTIHRATNLLPMDSNGFSDPFVKLCLIENVTNNHRQRVFDYSIARITAKKLVSKKTTNRNAQSTTIKWKTLNPEWNEEFAFATRLTDLMKFTLYLTVWDKDFGKSNDYLGGLELSCNSKGARLRHWIDVIKFPDHRHRAWHNLIDTILPIE